VRKLAAVVCGKRCLRSDYTPRALDDPASNSEVLDGRYALTKSDPNLAGESVSACGDCFGHGFVQDGVIHPIYNLLPTEIEGFDSLAELALDMHWSWNHATDEVWRQLDAELWKITHNPWVVLQTASRDAWKASPPNDFPNYAGGTWGPDTTQGLLVHQGHS
jgi:hypothetical protein